MESTTDLYSSQFVETPASNKRTQSAAMPLAGVSATSWIWLAVGIILLPFANGGWSIPIVAWIAPVCLLRFVRTQRALIGLPIALLALGSAFAFQFHGMIPIPGVGYYIVAATVGIVAVIPYALDRWFSTRLSGIPKTLVFPVVVISISYLFSFGSAGSWGAVAYSQYGSLALLQILSITGMAGIAFLIAWFAAVVNWLLEDRLGSGPARRTAAAFGLLLAAIILFGEVRLSLFQPKAGTTRIASLSRTDIEPALSADIWNHLFENKATPAEIEQIGRRAAAVNDDLLARAEREALAGAKIVFWGETNAMVYKQDESVFVQRGRDLAAKHKIYLGMAVGVWTIGKTPPQEKPLENKIILIDPDGNVAWEYYKTHPVMGSEEAVSVTKDGKLQALDSPYGRISSVICFDGDFPRLLSQAGALHTDVLLDPSNDWQAIDPWHTQMASFRSIEQGFNLVRQTSNGLSAAFDYQGRRLSAMDHYEASDHALISQVPTRGVRTVYSMLGDWLSWLCMMGFALLTVKALWRRSANSPL